MESKQKIKTNITKTKILNAAEEEFSELGFHGARVDNIAKKAGINKRMIYAHYSNKEGLYSSVLEKAYGKLADHESSYSALLLSPTKAIENIIRSSFEFLQKNQSFVRLLMWENLNRGSLIPKSTVALIKAPSFDYMKTIIRRGKETGEFREDADEYQTVISLMNFCFSYFSNLHTMSNITDVDLSSDSEIKKRIDYITEVILDYLSIKSSKGKEKND